MTIMIRIRYAAAALAASLLLAGCSAPNEPEPLKPKTTSATSSAAESVLESESTDEGSASDSTDPQNDESLPDDKKADSDTKKENKKDDKKEETDSIKKLISEMTLEQKVCQMFIVTPEGMTGDWQTTYFDEPLKQAIEKYPVGGIILFAQNLQDTEQAKALISDMQSCAKNSSGIGLFMAVDEEGGIVARCADTLGTTSFNNMAYYGKDNNRDTAYEIGSTLAKDISSIGFNLDFAPVADVDIDPGNELGERIFSSDPNVVANMVCGVVAGLQDNNVCATLKHFPGLGAEDGNTHTSSFVVIDRTVDQLRETELVPFKQAIDEGAAFVMVGHQIVTGFGDELPCDLSYKCVTEILRNELGFDGIAVTDSQLMNTISTVYGAGEAAKKSIAAGIDIVLMPSDLPGAISAVVEAVNSGEISEEQIDKSVTRILERKRTLGLI